MRVLALNVQRFGALSQQRFELDGRLFVVLGPNETGKSSFHQALETVFYGFDPASRDTHPYATWDPGAGPLALEAEIELDSGERLRVERVLQSSPGLRLAAPGEEFRGRREGNGPLPQLQSVPRDLFRAVYSLTSNDTHFHADEVREHIRELLLGETGLRGARPIHRVRVELAADLRRLWKPDNTGHRAKRLREALTGARRDLREARRAERELADEADERGVLEAAVADLRERRRALAREAEQAQFLAQVAELRRRADGARPLRWGALEGEPMVDPVELREEVETLERELAGPRARSAREEPGPDETDALLLGRAPAIAAARREAAHHAQDRARRDALLERAQEAEDRAHQLLTRLSVGPPPSADALLTFPIDGLRAAAAGWREGSSQGRAAGRPPGWSLVLGGLGLVTVGAAAAGTIPPIWAALGVLGPLLPLALSLGGGPATPPRPGDVERLLAELDLDPSVAPTPDALAQVAERLDEVRTLLVNAAGWRAGAAELGRAAVARATRWRELARGAELEPGGSGLALLEHLEAALADALQRAEARRETRAERARDRALVDARAPTLERLRARLMRVEAALAANFPGLDPAAAQRAWCRAEKERDFVTERERELSADPRWERLADDRRLDLAGDAAPWSASAREAREVELTGTEDDLAAKERRLGELRAHLEGDEGSRLARAAEGVAALEEELDGVRRERDRLALLGRVLAEAERLHRKDHQPDVLRRASEYLTAVTEGRYGRLDYPSGEESDLHVECADRGEALPVGPPLSRGTREQVYLCLRLGTLDYLDQGREGLPLLLDEALVHWDDERRARLYPVLAQIAERRQVVLFTCHPEVAEEVRGALSAAVIDLGRLPSEVRG